MLSLILLIWSGQLSKYWGIRDKMISLDKLYQELRNNLWGYHFCTSFVRILKMLDYINFIECLAEPLITSSIVHSAAVPSITTVLQFCQQSDSWNKNQKCYWESISDIVFSTIRSPGNTFALSTKKSNSPFSLQFSSQLDMKNKWRRIVKRRRFRKSRRSTPLTWNLDSRISRWFRMSEKASITPIMKCIKNPSEKRERRRYGQIQAFLCPAE